MKRRKWQQAMLLICVMLLVLTGCSVRKITPTTAKADRTYIYCMDSKAEKLYAVEYKPEHSSYAEVINEYLAEMKKIGRTDGYAEVFPEGLNLRSYSYENGLLTLDFNAIYYTMDDLQEAITRSAIVLTMLQLPDVEEVLITVDGSELQNTLKRRIGPMTREDVLTDWQVVAP